MQKNGFNPWKFLAVFLVVFFLFAVFLYIIDFVPETPGSATVANVQNSPVATTPTVQAETTKFPIENPVRVVIPAVGINTPVTNPSSTNVDTLNTALLNGAVRYPESAHLGENARMYIFGHQSYLPIVHNQAFKAFNGLQKLKSGDEIIVYSNTTAYEYRVFSVQHVTASDGSVALGSGDRTLTLTTCDSFGTKSDRYVVEAQFIGPLVKS